MERLLLESITAQQNIGNDTILCTIAESSGSTPRGTGAQMLVGAIGLICGTIGGGSAELLSLSHCGMLLQKRCNDRHSFAMHPNGAEDIGMLCGGDVAVDFRYISAGDALWNAIAAEALRRIDSREGGMLSFGSKDIALLDPRGKVLLGTDSADAFYLPLIVGERAVVFGGGHIASYLVPLLKTVGFRVTVLDNRPAFTTRERFPDAEEILLCDYAEVEKAITLSRDDYIVVMTNGHSGDLDIQRQVLPLRSRYVGVIGSRKKTAFVNGKLREAGIAQELIETVHTPIGTAIGAVTPAEIAVSIAGEMIQVRAKHREDAGEVAHGCPMHSPES